MQRRIIANRVTRTATIEEWAGGQWVLVGRGGPDVCTMNHQEIKSDLARFRRLELAGFQDAGNGYQLELRFCPAACCRSTLAIWLDAAGNPCEAQS